MLEITQREGYVHASINRPELRNAIDQELVNELHEMCSQLEYEPQILVITGTKLPDGRGIFASGADISEMIHRSRQDALRGVNSTVFDRIRHLPLPVIAAIDGFALGGGAELAWACDLRVATTSVKFGQPEVGLGIVAGAGALWRLKELVGEPMAKELVYTGRILSAEEALNLGLVNEVCQPEALEVTVAQLVEKLCAQDPLALQLTKTVIDMPAQAHPWVDNLAQAVAFESPAKAERMQAFLDRKKNK